MGQGGADQGVELPAVVRFQCVLDIGHACQHGFMVGRRVGQLLCQVVVVGQQGFERAQAFGNGFEDGVPVGKYWLLRYVGYLDIALLDDAAIVQLYRAGDGFQ